MKLSSTTFVLVGVVALLPALVRAQNSDQQELIDIEKAFAANPNPGPEAVTVLKRHAYDGSLSGVSRLGQVGTWSKAEMIDLSSRPDQSDPDVKESLTDSDFHVEMYGDTALVSYRVKRTDIGHKDPTLNRTDHYGCLDTFVKRNGHWYVIGDACTPSEPLPESAWVGGEPSSASVTSASSIPEDRPKGGRGSIGIMWPAEATGELVLSQVVKSGPAYAAGLRPGDIILSMDNQPVSSGQDFIRFMAEKQPGAKVFIKFRRSNEVTGGRGSSQDGIRVARADGFWADIGLQKDQTILEINKKPVHSPDDFRAVVGGMQKSQDVVLLVHPPNLRGTIFLAGTLTDRVASLDQIEFSSSNGHIAPSRESSTDLASRESTVTVIVADRAKLFASSPGEQPQNGASDPVLDAIFGQNSGKGATDASEGDWPYTVQFFNISGNTWHIRWSATSDNSCRQPLATRNDIAGDDTIRPLPDGRVRFENQGFPNKIASVFPASGHRFSCPKHAFICVWNYEDRHYDRLVDCDQIQKFIDSLQDKSEQWKGRFMGDDQFIYGNLVGILSTR